MRKITALFTAAIMLIAYTGAFAAETVGYVDENGNARSTSATVVTSGDSEWSGTYIAKGDITLSNRIKVRGAVSLILADGATLHSSEGINVSEGNSFTLYGQSGKTGLLKITMSDKDDERALIGGNKSENCGNVTINSGNISLDMKGDGAGIGGGVGGSGGKITVNGGNTQIAYGSVSMYFTALAAGAGIGGGDGGGAGEIVINGGSIKCSGASASAGIGGGSEENRNGSVKINGGEIDVENSGHGACIGSGMECASAVSVIINGGTINAKQDGRGAAIGSGYCFVSGDGTPSSVEINGGNIRAQGTHGAAIGAGGSAKCGAIEINGGYVATEGTYGIGRGEDPQSGYATLCVDKNAVVFASSVKLNDSEISYKSGIVLNSETKRGRVYASMTLEQDLTVPEGMLFTVPENVTLTVPAGVALNIEGSLMLGGDIVGSYVAPKPSFFYQDTQRNEAEARVDFITAQSRELNDGWYAVRKDTVIEGDLNVKGAASLAVTDGVTLTINGSINIDGSLDVYAQSTGSGKINVSGGVKGGALRACGGKINVAQALESALEMTGNAFVTAQSVSNLAENAKGILKIGSEVTIYGRVLFDNDLTIAAGEKLTVPSGAELVIMPEAKLISTGEVENNGTITVYGDFSDNGAIKGNRTGGVKKGGYVFFGYYNSAPILWRCADVDRKNGAALLISDKIISMKPFDAKEGTYGSNSWEVSNMRAWLNSDEQNVTWLCAYPPTTSDTTMNAYDSERGFLKNFTQGEKDAIYQDTPTSDKMFLPDSAQAALADLKCEATQRALYCTDNGDENAAQSYWLRDAGRFNGYEQIVTADGNFNMKEVYEGNCGVRPAFYLKSDTKIMYGEGSNSAPYVPYTFVGEGSEASPYIIEGAESLDYLRRAVENSSTFENEYFALEGDIDLSQMYGEDVFDESISWKSIGADFKGNIDGRSHAIRGLYISSSSTQAHNDALFYRVNENSTIRNLEVEGSVTSNNYVALFAGQNNGTIKNCLARGLVSGQLFIGSFAGSNSGRIENCYTDTSVRGSDMYGMAAGGGTGSVERCYYDVEAHTIQDEKCVALTTDQIFSGETAWLLQRESGEEYLVWGQELQYNSTDPLLTSAESRRVCKMTFSASGAEYAAEYIMAGKRYQSRTYPAPQSGNFRFMYLSFDEDGATEITSNELYNYVVTDDCTLYAVGEVKYGKTGEGCYVELEYGETLEADLSQFVSYATGAPSAGAFRYIITDGNDDLGAWVSGDVLKCANIPEMGIYTLTIEVRSKAPLVTMMGYDTANFEFTLDVVVKEHNYADDFLYVTVDEDTVANFYEISYSSDGILTDISVTDVELDEGLNAIDISESTADAFMVLDRNMRPLINKYLTK